MALHFGCLPTELEKNRSKTISTNCSNKAKRLLKPISNTPFTGFKKRKWKIGGRLLYWTGG
jgi:hypothetical protein